MLQFTFCSSEDCLYCFAHCSDADNVREESFSSAPFCTSWQGSMAAGAAQQWPEGEAAAPHILIDWKPRVALEAGPDYNPQRLLSLPHTPAKPHLPVSPNSATI